MNIIERRPKNSVHDRNAFFSILLSYSKHVTLFYHFVANQATEIVSKP